MAWFEAACSDSTEPGKESCARVLNSKYSYIPPKDPDKPDGRAHFPASFLGLLYYSLLFVWLVAIGRPSYDRRWLHAFPLILVGGGLAFSAYFMNIMYRVISEWCPWCLVTHAINLLIALGLIVLWPRRSASTSEQETATGLGAVSQEAAPRTAHPSGRLIATTVLAGLFVVYGHFFYFGWREEKKNLMDTRAEVDFLRSNVGPYIAQWQLAAPCNIVTYPDESIRPVPASAAGKPALDVLIFSDFECPACARFASFFEKNIPQMFDHRLRVMYRHYPLDQACNQGSVKTVHPYACATAYLAEAARTLGGDSAFWKAHDFLFEHQSETAAGTMSAMRLAEGIGLDAAALESAATPASAMARITRDLEQVRACGLRATPGIYVEGRKIESAAASNVQFWDKLADWFWKEKAKEPRPASTRLQSPPTQEPASKG